MTLWLTLIVVLQTAPAAPATPARLMSYGETVRCAGLTQAASELEGGESREGKALSDAALYWSLTAGQAAVTAGKSPAVADGEQAQARIRATRDLTSAVSQVQARSDLDQCRRRTPDLG